MGLLPQNIQQRAFVISLIYVGLGTLAVCSIYPADTFFFGGWAIFGMIFTFPVSIISFGYRYANADSLGAVFVIQAIMLALTYAVVVSYLLRKNKNI